MWSFFEKLVTIRNNFECEFFTAKTSFYSSNNSYKKILKNFTKRMKMCPSIKNSKPVHKSLVHMYFPQTPSPYMDKNDNFWPPFSGHMIYGCPMMPNHYTLEHSTHVESSESTVHYISVDDFLSVIYTNTYLFGLSIPSTTMSTSITS